MYQGYLSIHRNSKKKLNKEEQDWNEHIATNKQNISDLVLTILLLQSSLKLHRVSVSITEFNIFTVKETIKENGVSLQLSKQNQHFHSKASKTSIFTTVKETIVVSSQIRSIP